MVSFKDIGNKTNDDMAATMNTIVNGSASVLVYSIIGKGIKNSFTSLKAIDDGVAEPVINYACAGMYAAFFISKALTTESSDQKTSAEFSKNHKE